MPMTINMQDSGDARRVQRVSVKTQAGVREQSTRRISADLLDLSVTGFRISSTSTISVGARIFVTLPNLGGLESIVEWRDGDIYGCSFAKPLHPSVHDHLVGRYPGPSDDS